MIWIIFMLLGFVVYQDYRFTQFRNRLEAVIVDRNYRITQLTDQNTELSECLEKQTRKLLRNNRKI